MRSGEEWRTLGKEDHFLIFKGYILSEMYCRIFQGQRDYFMSQSYSSYCWICNTNNCPKVGSLYEIGT